jgi:hypothetical protein
MSRRSGISSGNDRGVTHYAVIDAPLVEKREKGSENHRAWHRHVIIRTVRVTYSGASQHDHRCVNRPRGESIDGREASP